MSEPERTKPEPAERIIAAAAQHADKLSKITLRGGVVGRITWIVIFMCLSAMGMVWSVKSEWVTLIGLVLMFATVLTLGIKTLRFAEKNPQTALMEGAELLIHEQLKMNMIIKSQPSLDLKQAEDVSEPTKHPQLNAPEVVNLPDESVGVPAADQQAASASNPPRSGGEETIEPEGPPPDERGGPRPPRHRRKRE